MNGRAQYRVVSPCRFAREINVARRMANPLAEQEGYTRYDAVHFTVTRGSTTTAAPRSPAFQLIAMSRSHMSDVLTGA